MTFPSKEISTDQERSEYMVGLRQWFVDRTELLTRAINASLVTFSEGSATELYMQRDFSREQTLMINIYLSDYDPRFHTISIGLGYLEVTYQLGIEAFANPRGGENILFEQLDILPEGMGLKLRRTVSDPRTITYIDALGNITTETTSPFNG